MEIAPIELTTDTASADQLYLSFALADQDYAVPITEVQEIREWNRVTPLPNSPHYVKGVVNLRGTIVPVIDMRLRFGLAEKDYDAFTVIVVVNVGGRLAGLVVDSVSDVIRVGAEERCSMSEVEGQTDRAYLEGLAQRDGRLLILLNVGRMLKPDDLATAAGSSQ